jgi:outer membrane lipoprotein carrier protein
MKYFCLLLLIVFLNAFSLQASPAKIKSEEVLVSETLDKMQKFWDSFTTYRANFNQIVNSKRLGTRDNSKGVLYVKKPGKLRWELAADTSFQIMNGKKLQYIHKTRRGQIIVDEVDDVKDQVDTRALQFLAGKGNFKQLYKAKLEENKPKSISIRLTPKEGGAESYIAEVDKNSYGIQSLTTETPETRARMEFSDIKINIELEDSLFVYEPKSTDMVHKGG